MSDRPSNSGDERPPKGELSERPSDEKPNAGEGGKGRKFEIEWFEEEDEQPKGGMFSPPRPEPAPQPFEVIRESAPPKSKAATETKGETEASGASGQSETEGEGGERQKMRGRDARATKESRDQEARPPLWKRLAWGTMPLLLLLGGYAAVVLTQGRIGYAWDEAYYYEPSMLAADWLTEALRGGRPFDAETIDEYWGERWEHPSLPRLACGVAIRFFKDPEDHLHAMRLPGAIFFGLSLTLIYLLGRRAWGVWPGLTSALIFGTMPRVFGHAHFASLEMPLICMTLLVVYCYLRGLDSAWWSVLTGVAFGLLLATKINGWFLPAPLILWSHLYARRQYVNNLFAMLTLGPLAMVAVWPWLWPDPPARLLAYLQFHAQHQQTALYFLGKTWGYGRVNAPWFYPPWMIGVTVPPVSLTLIMIGVAKTAPKAPWRPHAALFLLIAVTMLAVACAPSTPRYDGVRLFLPVFPFLALLGGSSFVSLTRIVERRGVRAGFAGPPSQFGPARLVRYALPLLITAEGVFACVRSYPFLLSYFNPVVGGVAGAAERGYEVTYWGDALNREVVETLNRLPDGASIKPLALHELCFTQMQEWGTLKPELRIGGAPPYDYHLLQTRRGFFGYPEKALADGGRYKPIASWGPPGVPLLALYETGAAFDEYWVELKRGRVFGP